MTIQQKLDKQFCLTEMWRSGANNLFADTDHTTNDIISSKVWIECDYCPDLCLRDQQLINRNVCCFECKMTRQRMVAKSYKKLSKGN